jgi:hypothetical protein
MPRGRNGGNWLPASARTAGRYAQASRFTRHFVAGKLRHDPLYPALLALGAAEGFGEVIDIGSGRGQLGILLLEAGLASRVTAIDGNAAALAQAAQAAIGLPLAIARRDLAACQALPPGDTLVMADLLYQLPPAAQLALAGEAGSKARRRVIIRTLDPERGWRSRAAIALERLGRLGWPHSGALVNPLPVAHLAAPLSNAGFVIKVTPNWQGTPFANVLMLAQKP